MSSNTNDFYALLGVSSDASAKQIEKAYKKQAMKYHPDRNIDDEENAKRKFQEIARAHEVLKDPAKRAIYDKHGEQGLETSGFHFDVDNIDLDALFNVVFEDDDECDDMDDEKRNCDKSGDTVLASLSIEVTLQELYTGTTKQVSYEYEYACKKCHGEGSVPHQYHTTCGNCKGTGKYKEYGWHTNTCESCEGAGWVDYTPLPRCTACNGSGRQYVSSRSYEERACSQCEGTGQKKARDDWNSNKCKVCDGEGQIPNGGWAGCSGKLKTCDVCCGSGQGTTRKCTECGGKGTKTLWGAKLDVTCSKCTVGKVVQNGRKRCSSCKDGKNKSCAQNTVQVEAGTNHGDVIRLEHIDNVFGVVKIKVNCKPHRNIKRNEDDLIIKQTVSLRQALLGGEFMIAHIDGSRLLVEPDHNVLQNNGLKTVKGKGMPVKGRDGEFGDLFIQFEIQMPKTLDRSQIAAVCKYLPPDPVQKKGKHAKTQKVRLSEPTELDKHLIIGDASMGDRQDGTNEDGEKVECKQM